QHDSRADHHAGRNANTLLDLHRCSALGGLTAALSFNVAHSPSPNLSANNCANFSTACSASSPSASMRIFVPGTAASMIICITLFPSASPGSSPNFVTLISLLNELARSTNCIAGRACSPSLFVTMMSFEAVGMGEDSGFGVQGSGRISLLNPEP